MKAPPVTEPLRYAGGILHVLDQTRLPGEEVWLALEDVDAVVEAIGSLRVRGAPLIGIAAAYGLASAAGRGEDVAEAAARLRAARPTAVNLARAVERVVGAADPAAEARAIHDEEVAACVEMGRRGAELLAPGANVMTICNTGSLATGGIGTAFGVIRTSDVGHVWVPETRPLLQGARLTTWELARLGIPHTLVADSATAQAFARGDVDAVLVGADRIAANGDVANKVGTLMLAVLARHHDVPFYVVAPTSTIDASVASGAAIPIEHRAPDEVRAAGALPEGTAVLNPAFDVTPAALVTAIVTETAVYRPPYAF